MLADLTMMKTQLRCDIKAMMLHRGSEYRIKPNKVQVDQAHSLIDNGLDIII
jgi:poly-gamma-glutamate capsule biosynthesis protein CapA/YwtB (metallophosphatase superfamily)